MRKYPLLDYPQGKHTAAPEDVPAGDLNKFNALSLDMYDLPIPAESITGTMPSTHITGTANQVGYFNASKLLTSDATLTYDGSTVGIGVTPSSGYKLHVKDTSNPQLRLEGASSSTVTLDTSTAAGTFAHDQSIWHFKNGTGAQQIYTYNTEVSTSVYERAGIYWASDVFNVVVQKAGATTDRDMRIGNTTTTGTLNFMTGNTERIQVDASGNLITRLDNAYNIGASGATRFKDLYLSGNVTAGGNGVFNTLETLGGLTAEIDAFTSAQTLDGTHYTATCDASSAAFTVTLPALSGITGRIYHIKKTDSSGNAVTVDADGSETIDGFTTKVITTQYNSMMIQAGASEWHIL